MTDSNIIASAAVDPNTATAPLRENSSTRIAIGLGVMIFFAVCIVWLALKGTGTDALHQTLMTGSLWIIGVLTGWLTTGATAGFTVPGFKVGG